MKIVWPTRSRTGSQFVLNLTTALVGGSNLQNQSRINGSRKETYHAEKKKGVFTVANGLRYINDNDIQSMKYEDPGKDDFVLEVLKAHPEAKFVCSYRSLERVISSHFNIKKWGHHESDVIYQFSASLALYKDIFNAGRLLMVDITNPNDFDHNKFADALGVTPKSAFLDLVAGWKPVNDLKYQVEKTETYSEDLVQPPPRIDRLRNIHPWVIDLEQEYLNLCRETTQVSKAKVVENFSTVDNLCVN